jgi:hypothetical protein
MLLILLRVQQQQQQQQKQQQEWVFGVMVSSNSHSLHCHAQHINFVHPCWRSCFMV